MTHCIRLHVFLNTDFIIVIFRKSGNIQLEEINGIYGATG